MPNPDLIMPIAIAIIMYGIGITLKFKDFKRVFLYPRGILTGLFAQLFLLPLIAFVMCWFLPIDPVYKVGIILLASAPGGTASNLVTTMLKGRVALSVSMTSFNSFVILFTIPLFVNLALEIFLGKTTTIELSFLNTFKDILFTVVLPVVAGILTNEYTPRRFTLRLKRPLRYVLPTLLLTVFAYGLFFEDDGQPLQLIENLELFIPLVFFNVLTMFVGFYVAKSMAIDHDGCYTISVEMGLQNSALAIFIATQILESSEISLVAVIYSSFTFFSTWGLAWVMKHYMGGRKEDGR
jgi:BASS family bile acid:Na+ symporter